jgi:hypothetical protein
VNRNEPFSLGIRGAPEYQPITDPPMTNTNAHTKHRHRDATPKETENKRALLEVDHRIIAYFASSWAIQLPNTRHRITDWNLDEGSWSEQRVRQEWRYTRRPCFMSVQQKERKE